MSPGKGPGTGSPAVLPPLRGAPQVPVPYERVIERRVPVPVEQIVEKVVTVPKYYVRTERVEVVVVAPPF